MQVTKYGSYDAIHANNTLTLNGPNLGKTPTGTTEMWITGAGSKADTGINGNTWVIRNPDGTWHVRTPEPSVKCGKHKQNDQGQWTTHTQPTTPEQNQTLETARTRA
jgi:hypothetical protein